MVDKVYRSLINYRLKHTKLNLTVIKYTGDDT